jgi:hypothetical protein
MGDLSPDLFLNKKKKRRKKKISSQNQTKQKFIELN